jgi:hypothetical protein
MAKKLIAFEPAPQEISDLRSLLNRLDVLEKNVRRELNRLEKAGKTLTFHRLEQQSITRSIKRHEAEIVSFKNAARDCVNASPCCNGALNCSRLYRVWVRRQLGF